LKVEKRNQMKLPNTDKARVKREQMVESRGPVAPAKLPPGAAADVSTASELATANELTPEEQMALFEKDLKENDWGHRPC
jgi:hypothetical protein